MSPPELCTGHLCRPLCIPLAVTFHPSLITETHCSWWGEGVAGKGPEVDAHAPSSRAGDDKWDQMDKSGSQAPGTPRDSFGPRERRTKAGTPILTFTRNRAALHYGVRQQVPAGEGTDPRSPECWPCLLSDWTLGLWVSLLNWTVRGLNQTCIE